MKVTDSEFDLGNGSKVKNPFADILQSIGDEQKRAAIIAALDETPAGQEMLKKLAIKADNGQKYEEYYNGDRTQLVAEKARLEAQLAALNTNPPRKGNDPIVPAEFNLEDAKFPELMAEVEKSLRGKGFVSRSEVEQLAEQKAREMAAQTQVYLATQGLPAVESYVQAPMRFQAEFGKAMDIQGFKKFVADNKFTDIGRAYEAFTQDARIEKIKADAFAQGQAKGTQDATTEFQKRQQAEALRSMPTDITGSQGIPGLNGAPPPKSEIDEKLGTDYQLGRKGGFKLAHAVAEKIAADRAAGKVI